MKINPHMLSWYDLKLFWAVLRRWLWNDLVRKLKLAKGFYWQSPMAPKWVIHFTHGTTTYRWMVVAVKRRAR